MNLRKLINFFIPGATPHISYVHKKTKRAKRVRLSVHHDGRVVVTSPYRVSDFIIRKFVDDKKDWILEKMADFKEKEKKIEQSTGRVVRRFTREDYLEYKEQARLLVADRIIFYNMQYGFTLGRIAIKDQKSRWGSCSSRGNININYKILFLPKEQQDYIIVHELCHLREFNHSERFWKLVEKAVPDYMEIRKELRTEELLHR